MSPQERLAYILDKLNITTMPRYWANIISLELKSHGITLEDAHAESGNHRQGDLLSQRQVPTPGAVLLAGQESNVRGGSLGERKSGASAPGAATSA